MTRYMYDRSLPSDFIFVVRQAGNCYEHWSEVEMNWILDDICMAVFTGMDDDFRTITEAEALSMIDKFKSRIKP